MSAAPTFGSTATQTLTVPAGDYVEIGLQGNMGSSAVSADTNGGQPADLGIAAVSVGYNTGNSTTAGLQGSATNVTFNANFDAGNSLNGNITGGSSAVSLGKIQESNSAADVAAATGNSPVLTIGATGNTDLFTGLELYTGGTAGTTTLTPVEGTWARVTTNSTTANTYKTAALTETLEALTITTTTGSSTHPIISLTSSAPSGYGTSQGAFNTVGSGGAYGVSTVAVSPSVNLGYVGQSGAFASGDKQIYGMDIVDNTVSGAGLSTELGILEADVNSGALSTTGAVASLTSPSPALPSYDNFFVTFANGNSLTSPSFGWDVTSSNDTNLADALVVSSVSAVPEPATMAGVLFGAASLLLNRRKRKA
jgi:hypothetical protein